MRKKRRVSKRAKRPIRKREATTLKDHLVELQGRLFSTLAVFILASAIAYPFFEQISNWLVAPLDNRQELVYLTPGGAFVFIIKVCIYVGIIATLPVIIYQIYRFAMPAVRAVRLRAIIGYTTASLLLAIVGILFAYYISLPAALKFLTGFDLHHINPMITIDSYFSFIMTYMLAGALLFQVPLVILIINSIKPLTPKKMMGAQRHIILGSFIVAAIISPTPDAVNQAILASPAIIMYQLGIILVWLVNSRAKSKEPKLVAIPIEDAEIMTASPAAISTSSVVMPRPKSMDIISAPRPTMPKSVQLVRPLTERSSIERSLSRSRVTPIGPRSMDYLVARGRPGQYVR